MYHLTALVTCLVILFYLFTSIQVSKARVAFGVKVPATSGNPDFERVFRVQMNTLEWMPIFLPSLWLFAIYISDIGAALLGLERDENRFSHNRRWRSNLRTRWMRRCRGSDRSHCRRPRLFALQPCAANV
jgi:MAPEG family